MIKKIFLKYYQNQNIELMNKIMRMKQILKFIEIDNQVLLLEKDKKVKENMIFQIIIQEKILLKKLNNQ